MYCNNCGNPLENNACVCNRCGAFCSSGANPFLYSKKEYFASDSCSENSKRFTWISWILLGVLAFILAFNMANAVFLFSDMLEDLADCQDYDSVMKVIEENMGASLGVQPEMEGLSEAEFDLFLSTLETTIIVTLVFMCLLALGAVIFTLFAIAKKNRQCAIWGLVLSALTLLNVITLGCSISILVFACKWHKEYRDYCLNPMSGNTNTTFNFS